MKLNPLSGAELSTAVGSLSPSPPSAPPPMKLKPEEAAGGVVEARGGGAGELLSFRSRPPNIFRGEDEATTFVQLKVYFH